jgi:hypothetical protein
MMIEQVSTLRWYKQPLVWMLIVIPGSAVVAGFYTLYLAIVSFDGMVVDDYYKQGKEINRVLARDQKAEVLGLTANASFDSNTKQVNLVLKASNKLFEFPQRLKLSFLHSTRAGNDQQIALVLERPGFYRGVLPQLVPGRWDVLLEDVQWRLVGNLAKVDNRAQVSLKPSV